MDPIVVDRTNHPGWIEVVCGSMFSGKTEELIRRLNRARIARQKVEIFKPAIDARFSEDEVVSHDSNAIQSSPVDSAHQIILMAGGAQVIGIDEAQFFGPELVEVCRQLAESGKRVIVAGLDQDYLGQPFDPIPQLMAIAEYVTKLHAICVVCGSPANHSQRIVENSGRVVVGAGESYEPRCRRCFRPHQSIRTPLPEQKPGSIVMPVVPPRTTDEDASATSEGELPGWTQLDRGSFFGGPSPSPDGDGLASDAIDLTDGLS